MATPKTPKLCFVIMPFSEERKEVYKHGIAPACRRADFAPVRVDELKGHFNINRKIIEHIFRSDAVIAEITDHNPNVFYEMGVAHAIANKTIMIAQNAKALPFDISNYRCLIYKQSVDGLKELQDAIVESLRELEKWSQQPSNPVQDFKPYDAFVPVGEVETLQQELARQAAENTRLAEELEHLRSSEMKPAPPAISTAPVLQLRSLRFDTLSGQAVKAMLKRHDFYCDETDWSREWCNPNGQGIKHDFVSAQTGKVLVDQVTGLIWQRSGSPNYINFVDADKFVSELNKDRFASYYDWRLPTLEEAMSLMAREKKSGDLYIDPVFDRQQQWIWTADFESAGRAWYVYFSDGFCNHRHIFVDAFVRAVRS